MSQAGEGCGCRVGIISAKNHEYTIGYCPLHLNAGRLLEELKRIHRLMTAFIALGIEAETNRQAVQISIPDWKERLEKIKQVVDQIEGKQA